MAEIKCVKCRAYDLTEENSKLHKEFLVTEDGRVFYWRTLLDKIELVDDEIPEGMVEGLQEGDTYRHFNAIWVIRELDTELAEVYSVEIPVITAWVRDDNYVHSTKEIFLGEPSLEGFLHQFRHHLQNKAREPQYKYLLVENDPKADYRIPYKDCMYRMYGEDDARAWARMVIELAS